MWVIVGLGNPGREYEDTRHNVGFKVVERLVERCGARFSDKKFKARMARGRLQGEDCWLVEPQTFMNLSGESVGPALGFYKLGTEQLVVVHDDLDLDVGRLKLKKGGGHGGHNGLRSLVKHLPDAGFTRIRVGVGRPPASWDAADYVLSPFRADEARLMDRALEEAADAVEAIIRDGLRKAMNVYNRAPERAEESDAQGADGRRGSSDDAGGRR